MTRDVMITLITPVTTTDEYGIPYSSGNPRSYSQTLLQSVLDRIYVQFAVIAKRYE